MQNGPLNNQLQGVKTTTEKPQPTVAGLNLGNLGQTANERVGANIDSFTESQKQEVERFFTVIRKFSPDRDDTRYTGTEGYARRLVAMLRSKFYADETTDAQRKAFYTILKNTVNKKGVSALESPLNILAHAKAYFVKWLPTDKSTSGIFVNEDFLLSSENIITKLAHTIVPETEYTSFVTSLAPNESENDTTTDTPYNPHTLLSEDVIKQNKAGEPVLDKKTGQPILMSEEERDTSPKILHERTSDRTKRMRILVNEILDPLYKSADSFQDTQPQLAKFQKLIALRTKRRMYEVMLGVLKSDTYSDDIEKLKLIDRALAKAVSAPTDEKTFTESFDLLNPETGLATLEEHVRVYFENMKAGTLKEIDAGSNFVKTVVGAVTTFNFTNLDTLKGQGPLLRALEKEEGLLKDSTADSLPTLERNITELENQINTEMPRQKTQEIQSTLDTYKKIADTERKIFLLTRQFTNVKSLTSPLESIIREDIEITEPILTYAQYLSSFMQQHKTSIQNVIDVSNEVLQNISLPTHIQHTLQTRIIGTANELGNTLNKEIAHVNNFLKSHSVETQLTQQITRKDVESALLSAETGVDIDTARSLTTLKHDISSLQRLVEYPDKKKTAVARMNTLITKLDSQLQAHIKSDTDPIHIQNLEDEIADLKNTLADVGVAIQKEEDKLHNTIKEREEEIATLKSQLDELSGAQEDNAYLTNEKKELENKVTALEADLTQLKDLPDTSDELEKLKTELSDLGGMLKNVRKDLYRNEAGLALESEDHMHTLDSTISAIEGRDKELEALKTRNDELERELANSNKGTTSINTQQLKDLQTQIQDEKARTSEAEKETNELHTMLAQANERVRHQDEIALALKSIVPTALENLKNGDGELAEKTLGALAKAITNITK